MGTKEKSPLSRKRPQKPSKVIIANTNTVVGNSQYSHYPSICRFVALRIRYRKKSSYGMLTGRAGHNVTQMSTVRMNYLHLIKTKGPKSI